MVSMARGSVFKRSGGWAFRIEAGLHPEAGNRRRIKRHGFRTKREDENALAKAQKTVYAGTVAATSSKRLDDYLDDWRASQEARLRPSSHHSSVIASKRLKKHLGCYKLPALTVPRPQLPGRASSDPQLKTWSSDQVKQFSRTSQQSSCARCVHDPRGDKHASWLFQRVRRGLVCRTHVDRECASRRS